MLNWTQRYVVLREFKASVPPLVIMLSFNQIVTGIVISLGVSLEMIVRKQGHDLMPAGMHFMINV